MNPNDSVDLLIQRACIVQALENAWKTHPLRSDSPSFSVAHFFAHFVGQVYWGGDRPVFDAIPDFPNVASLYISFIPSSLLFIIFIQLLPSCFWTISLAARLSAYTISYLVVLFDGLMTHPQNSGHFHIGTETQRPQTQDDQEWSRCLAFFLIVFVCVCVCVWVVIPVSCLSVACFKVLFFLLRLHNLPSFTDVTPTTLGAKDCGYDQTAMLSIYWVPLPEISRHGLHGKPIPTVHSLDKTAPLWPRGWP